MQFDEILLEPPVVTRVLAPETGELFVRLRARIWPQQQWAIEAQIAPRIREILKQEGIEIPGDRVVVFYHVPPERIAEVGRGRTLRRSRRPRPHSAVPPASSANQEPSQT